MNFYFIFLFGNKSLIISDSLYSSFSTIWKILAISIFNNLCCKNYSNFYFVKFKKIVIYNNPIGNVFNVFDKFNVIFLGRCIFSYHTLFV